MQEQTINVFLSPLLLQVEDIENKIFVVADIFRASSSIITAINYGVQKIIPLKTVEEGLTYAQRGYVTAGERNGTKIPQFSIGNSPYSFMSASLNGKTVAMTTTNGTGALLKVSSAKQVLIGSFLNLSSLVSYLTSQQLSKEICILCAGSKGDFNLEDTLFAGALVSKLTSKRELQLQNDAAQAAALLYQQEKHNLVEVLKHCSRFEKVEHEERKKDLTYSLQEDIHPVIPVFRNGFISLLKD